MLYIEVPWSNHDLFLSSSNEGSQTNRNKWNTIQFLLKQWFLSSYVIFRPTLKSFYCAHRKSARIFSENGDTFTRLTIMFVQEICAFLTIARPIGFLCPDWAGLVRPTRRYEPNWARISRKEKQHAGRYETQRLVPKVKVSGQPVTS